MGSLSKGLPCLIAWLKCADTHRWKYSWMEPFKDKACHPWGTWIFSAAPEGSLRCVSVQDGRSIPFSNDMVVQDQCPLGSQEVLTVAHVPSPLGYVRLASTALREKQDLLSCVLPFRRLWGVGGWSCSNLMASIVCSLN